MSIPALFHLGYRNGRAAAVGCIVMILGAIAIGGSIIAGFVLVSGVVAIVVGHFTQPWVGVITFIAELVGVWFFFYREKKPEPEATQN